MKKIVCITGSNATGKSTRVREVVDHLDNVVCDTYSDFFYRFSKEDKKTGLIKYFHINAGRLYRKTGIFVLGSSSSNQAGWAGADKIFGKMGDKNTIYTFIEELMRNCDVAIFEGYFALKSKFMRNYVLRDRFKDTIPNVQYLSYFFFYNNIDEYIERTESRSGKPWKDRPEGVNKPILSRGWEENKCMISGLRLSLENSSKLDSSKEVSIDAPKKYFVNEFKDRGIL
jgi:hypothetical protein